MYLRHTHRIQCIQYGNVLNEWKQIFLAMPLFGLRKIRPCVIIRFVTYVFQAGHVEVVSFLLTKVRGIQVDPVNIQGFTPLMKAALQGRVKCSKLLLFSGRHLRGFFKTNFCNYRKVCAYGKSSLLQWKFAPGYSWHLAAVAMLAPRREVGA
jgi:hypothetical protein